MRFAPLILPCLLAFAVPASAQATGAPPKPALECPVPGGDAMGFFEFQVDPRARFIPDSTHPHPSAKQDTGSTLVQFLVDTSGVPIPTSLHILRIRPAVPVTTPLVRALMVHWRFTPAKLHGCSVQQLVQTSLDP